MANSFIPVDDKYYNAQLVGKVFTQVETDPDTQVETTHYIMETLGGQRKEIPQEIFDDIVNGEYTPGGVTVDDQISDTSENPVQNKVIYRQIQGVAEMAEGKSAAYVVDDEIDTAFNSQDSTITINSSFTDVNIGVVSLDKLRIGDVIYVTETDVPDRWVQTITKQGDEVISVTLGKMETAKVPVLDVQVNHQSTVTDGVAEITVDSALDSTSENPIKNKVVTEALSAVRGLSGTATLLANDWVNNEQSLVLSELGDDDAVFFYPSSSTDKELLESANVFVSASYSTVTFSAETTPSSDISLYYFIARGA